LPADRNRLPAFLFLSGDKRRRMEMPLVGDPGCQPFLHGRLRGVGFGMIANGDESLQRVRVVVTFHALAEMSHVYEIICFPVALDRFRSFRDRIEAGASRKFDRIASRLQDYDGLPTVLLMTGDPR
jgi:hypothetical protein